MTVCMILLVHKLLLYLCGEVISILFSCGSVDSLGRYLSQFIITSHVIVFCVIFPSNGFLFFLIFFFIYNIWCISLLRVKTKRKNYYFPSSLFINRVSCKLFTLEMQK